MCDVTILGAGITGLSCSWALRKLGIEARIVESTNRIGGVIRTERINGYLVECGPNTLLPTTVTAEILNEIDQSHMLIEAPEHAPRFIYLKGKLRRAPFGPMSLPGLLRVFGEPFIRSKSTGDESVAAFFRRRVGREAHDRLVAPFVSGIYGADSEQLSVSAAFPRLVEMEAKSGSLAAGMLTSPTKKTGRRLRTCSFVSGMETLPQLLAHKQRIHMGEKDAGVGSTKVTVVTAPAFKAARIVENQNPDLAMLLERVKYSPMVIAATSIAENSFEKPLHGFGFLAPRSEGLHILGTLFSSTMFPGRAPSGRVLLTAFVGGAYEPDVIEWPDERIFDTVSSELRRILKTAAIPEPVAVFRHRMAIPQYNVGHERWKESLTRELHRRPGLFVSGNYLNGVSVAACMEEGQRVALAVAEYLRSNK